MSWKGIRRRKENKKRNIFAEDEISQINRIIRNEKWVMLPLKVAVCIAAFVYMRYSTAEGTDLSHYRYALGIYAASTFLILLLQVELVRANLAAVRFSAYGLSFIDILYLCWMVRLTTVMTPEMRMVDNQLYWFYCALIVRNSANFPSLLRQTILNVMFIGTYVGIIWIYDGPANLLQPDFIVRPVLLLVLSFCGWGVLNQIFRQSADRLANQEMMLRREKFSSQVKLASEVAHELKNPLAIISNALYIARGNLKNDKAEKVDKQLDMIDSAVRRSDRIITDLLGYARMREGSIEASDVHESLDAALSMVLLSDSPPSNVTVSVDKEYDHDLPSLLIDPGQLKQVFINLIRNAIEAMDTTLDWLLSIKTEMDELNRTIVISIQDNGKGITPEDLERVFESFYTTKSMGSGLGLAIVRNIIENYNGTISLVSNIGVGTIVQIRFPLVISSGDGMSGAPIINIS
jgi:signal transduction histidine kinase